MGYRSDVGWACDLLPKPLLVAYAFADKQSVLDAKQAELETTEAALAGMVEEQSGDDGVFADFDKVNTKEVNARIKEIKNNSEFADEQSVLNDWTNKTKAIAALKKQVKEQDEARGRRESQARTRKASKRRDFRESPAQARKASKKHSFRAHEAEPRKNSKPCTLSYSKERK